MICWYRSKLQSTAGSTLWGSVQILCQWQPFGHWLAWRGAFLRSESGLFFLASGGPTTHCSSIISIISITQMIRMMEMMHWAAGQHCAQRRLYNCSILKNGARGKQPPKGFKPSEVSLSLHYHCTKWNAEIPRYFSVPCTSHLRHIRNLHSSRFA